MLKNMPLWLDWSMVIFVVTLVILYTIFRKKSSGDEPEEYTERYGKVVSIGIPVLLITIVAILRSAHFKSISSNDSFLYQILTSIWFWVILTAITIIILCAVFLPKTKKVNLKWLWIFPVLIVLYGGWRIWTNVYGAKNYPLLNTTGDNIMKKDEPKKLIFRYGGPTYYFSPKGNGPDTLTFTGNKWTWQRVIWRDSTGTTQRKLIGTRPPAFAGDCLVSCSKDAIVIVEEKIE